MIYMALIFLLPASKVSMQSYHLSGLEYKALFFAISIPSIATWIAAFIGYMKLRQYVNAIDGSPEGSDFATIGRGYAWLAWSLPIAATLNLLLSSLVNQWPRFLPTAVILHNYINLLLPLVAFTIMGTASRGLVNRSKLGFSSASIRSIMLIFLAGGVLYCFLTFQQFNLSTLSSTDNPYYLPLWLMVLTVIIPSLYSWFIGLLAAYEIMLFSSRTDGVLYRSALRLLVAGLVTIIVSFVAVQFTSSVNPNIGRLVLGGRLVLVLLFRLIGGAGFILVALGADRLKKIEEI
jgi:hypothetical protein